MTNSPTLNDDSELRKKVADILADAHIRHHWTCMPDCIDHEKSDSPIDQLMQLIYQRDEAREPKIEIKAKIEALDKLVLGAGEYHDDPYEYVVPLRHIKEYRAALDEFDLTQPIFKEQLITPKKTNNN